jgi:hypothetical protein
MPDDDEAIEKPASDIAQIARVDVSRLVRLIAWAGIAYGFYAVYFLQYLGPTTGQVAVAEGLLNSLSHGRLRGTGGLVYGGVHLMAGAGMVLGGLLVLRRDGFGWGLLRWGSLVLLLTIGIGLWGEIARSVTWYDGAMAVTYWSILWRNAVWRLPILVSPLMFCLIVWFVISPRKRAARKGFDVIPTAAA